MKVSVLISNYNYARYLPDAVRSVWQQTYENVEIIIVDDGSTDESALVLEQLQQQTVQPMTVIWQKNQGQGAAFNTGLAAATGEIIAFLDADDTWKPQKVQRIVDRLQQDDLVGVMHGLDLVDQTGKAIERRMGRVKIPGGDLAALLLKTGIAWHYPPTSGLAYRRSVLEKILPIDPVQWRLHTDGWLVYCTAFFGKVALLDEVLGSYRLHGNNYHALQQPSLAVQQQWLSGIDRTVQWLNQFLQQHGFREEVELSKNLDYRRARYYLQKQWDLAEALQISQLMFTWPFYSTWERSIYLTRFWLKTLRLLTTAKSEEVHP